MIKAVRITPNEGEARDNLETIIKHVHESYSNESTMAVSYTVLTRAQYQ